MFNEKLKEVREKKGLSQYELADKIFVSRSAIAKWESGNGIPSDVNINAICKFFDVEEEWLLDRQDLKDEIKNNNKKFINIKKYHLISLIIGIIFVALIYLDNIIKYGHLFEYGLYGWLFFGLLCVITLIPFYLLAYLICFIFHITFSRKILIYNENKNKDKKVNFLDILFTFLIFIGIILFVLTTINFYYVDNSFILKEDYFINGKGMIFLFISWILSVVIIVIGIFLEVNNILNKTIK